MKVVQVSLRFDAPGGVEATVRELSRRLRSAGDDVEVFASDLVDEAAWRRETQFRPEVDGIPVRRFAVRRQPLPGLTMPTMVGLLEALSRSDAGVIHAHSHRYGHVLTAAAAARRTGIPLVVSTHYHPADAGEPPWKKGLLRAEDFVFGAGAYRTARAIVVESALEARLVGEFAPPGRIHVIPPGIDLAEWADEATGRTAGPELPPRYLLFAGRLASNKGLAGLFEALALTPEADRLPLVLMGPSWGEDDTLRALAGRLKIDRQLVWLGEVRDRGAYRAVLRRASALVLPSVWEAFGLVLLDAMAAGVPIVATSVGAVPEVLENGRSGRLVPYGDPAALAAALREAAAGTATTREMVARGTERVRQFDWPTVTERVRALYRAVAS